MSNPDLPPTPPLGSQPSPSSSPHHMAPTPTASPTSTPYAVAPPVQEHPTPVDDSKLGQAASVLSRFAKLRSQQISGRSSKAALRKALVLLVPLILAFKGPSELASLFSGRVRPSPPTTAYTEYRELFAGEVQTDVVALRTGPGEYRTFVVFLKNTSGHALKNAHVKASMAYSTASADESISLVPSGATTAVLFRDYGTSGVATPETAATLKVEHVYGWIDELDTTETFASTYVSDLKIETSDTGTQQVVGLASAGGFVESTIWAKFPDGTVALIGAVAPSADGSFALPVPEGTALTGSETLFETISFQ